MGTFLGEGLEVRKLLCRKTHEGWQEDEGFLWAWVRVGRGESVVEIQKDCKFEKIGTLAGITGSCVLIGSLK